MKAIDELIGIADTLDEIGLVGTASALRRICSQLEDRGVETVKSEAMEALAFVKEHGGLEKARRELERAETWHLDKLEMYRLCTECGGVEGLKKRLMPEGMEWPKYDTGELVGFGSEFENGRGGASVLRTVLIKDCRETFGGDFYWKLGKGKNAVTLKNGERVKRPAPKVLDADGVEMPVHHPENRERRRYSHRLQRPRLFRL